jgi:hypothetical protein
MRMPMAEGYKNAFVGGLIGAVATALAGGAIALLPSVGNAITTRVVDTILTHLEVKLHQGGQLIIPILLLTARTTKK